MIRRAATLVLSSSIMGLLLTPPAYIGIGALGGFAAAFALTLAARVARRPTTQVAAGAEACALLLFGGSMAYLVMPSRFL